MDQDLVKQPDMTAMNAMFVPPQGTPSFTARTIKLDKTKRTAKYNVGFKGDFFKLEMPFQGVIVGLYRKYMLEEWDGNNEKVYSYHTTEYPYFDREANITILDKTEDKNVIEIGHIQAKDFKAWCISYDEKVQSKTRGLEPFVRSKKNDSTGEMELISTFSVRYILYIADVDFNIYRVELKGDSYQDMDTLTKNGFYEFGQGQMHKTLVEIGFNSAPADGAKFEYYPIYIKAVAPVSDPESVERYYSMLLQTYKAIGALHTYLHEKAIKEGNVREDIVVDPLPESAIDKTTATILKNKPKKEEEIVIEAVECEDVVETITKDDLADLFLDSEKDV